MRLSYRYYLCGLLLPFFFLTVTPITWQLPALHEPVTPSNTRFLFDVDEVLLVFPEGAIKNFLWNNGWSLLKNIGHAKTLYQLKKRGAPGREYADLFEQTGNSSLATAIKNLNESKLIMPGMELAVRRLHDAGFQLDIGTNKPDIDMQWYLKKYPDFFAMFTNIKAVKATTSQEKRTVEKPNPQYFYDYLAEFASDKKTIFWDDKKGNVQGAQAAGIEAYVFKDTASFVKDLAFLNIAGLSLPVA